MDGSSSIHELLFIHKLAEESQALIRPIDWAGRAYVGPILIGAHISYGCIAP